MGTSSARQAPVGKHWRTAKTFASRFASGQEASPPHAAEVIARYRAALSASAAESGTEPAALLPEVVRTAAALGDFYRHWEGKSWEAALASLGLNWRLHDPLEDILPALVDRLAGPGSRLAEAVVRTALIDHVEALFQPGAAGQQDQGQPVPHRPEPLAGVGHFLGLALFQTMLSDLGEPLEYHAPSRHQEIERQEELKAHFLAPVLTATACLTPEAAVSEEQIQALLARLFSLASGQKYA